MNAIKETTIVIGLIIIFSMPAALATAIVLGVAYLMGAQIVW